LNLNPEEHVRQLYIKKLIADGFSKNLIVVEKKISELPHLKLADKSKLPNRRVDILCYVKDRVELMPYLLIECKAVKLQEAMKRQIMGYNYYIKAPYLVLVSQDQELFASYDSDIKDYIWKQVR
jgi:hypothetical protein